MAERISEGEAVVMEVLWRESPLTSAEVAERVDPQRGWSERTVKTMLSRLVGKGALSFDEEGRRYLYRPAVSREDYVGGESRRLVDRLFGGRAAPLVAQLAESGELSDTDITEIEALLKELRK